ncbi:MAG: proline--tRNA ligase, partial [Clostridia bacterium]|nr:proline--tRNA ligase [Clostridia bacterium]
GVLDAAYALRDRLKSQFRVKVDDSDNSPGWKFSEYEMKGVPLRIEIGPRDIAEGKCVTVKRVNREKNFESLENIEEVIAQRLEEVRVAMFEKALANREARTYDCTTIDEIKTALAEKGDGLVMAMWCGDEECEDKVKAETGVGSRCIPLQQRRIAGKCVCCGKDAKHMVCWAVAY